MTIRKKQFPCGHRGKGAYCHRCRARELRKTQEREARLQTRWYPPPELKPWWTDLLQLPHASLRKKAAEVLLGILLQGLPYTNFGGKRMDFDRELISVPVGRSWRILLREESDKSKSLVSVLSHEKYNHCLH